MTSGAFEAITEVGTEAAPAVETDVPGRGAASDAPDEGARAALDRKSKRDSKKSQPTAETREFWETWAEEKSTRDTSPAIATPEAEETSDEERPREKSRGRDRDEKRGSRDKDRGRDKPRGERDKRTKSDTKHDKPVKADKEEVRGKRDTAYSPPPVMEGAQARLFISLGKKHGVTADDLRELLGNAIGGDKSRIGSVSLRDSHAHVRVPEDLADQIIEGVNGTQHNEHEVTVERARA